MPRRSGKQYQQLEKKMREKWEGQPNISVAELAKLANVRPHTAELWITRWQTESLASGKAILGKGATQVAAHDLVHAWLDVVDKLRQENRVLKQQVATERLNVESLVREKDRILHERIAKTLATPGD